MILSYRFKAAARPAVFTPHRLNRRGFRLLSSSLGKTGRPTGFLKGLVCLLPVLACLPATAAITLDARVSKDQNSASTTVTSPQFATTATNELLLAFISADSLQTPNTSVNSVTGAGLVWTRVVRTNAQEGTAEIWRAFAPARLSGASISAQLSQSVVSSLTVMTFSGVSTTGTNGSGAIGAVGTGNSSQGAPSASLVSTRSGSLVVGVGDDYDEAIARTPSPGQAIIHQDLSPTGDTYWVQQLTSSLAAAGTKATLSDSAPTSDRYNLSICEILPAAGAQLQPSATSLSFGAVTDGTSVTKSVTFTSNGASPVTVSSASLTGTGFSLDASSFPVTLAPGHSLTLQVVFDPKSIGAVTGQLTVNSNATTGSATNVALSGTGASDNPVPQIAVSSSSVAFGNVAEGSSASKSVTITSTGTSPLTITSGTESGSGFTVAGGPYPLTLGPGKTTTLVLTFKPTTAGAQTGKIAIVSNSAQNSTLRLGLSGTGTGVQHSVSLSWSPPSSSPVTVIGYDIYRALGGGAFVLLNSSPVVQTSYTDSSVGSGSTYTYEVKSVGSDGTQSTASNESTVTVPSS